MANAAPVIEDLGPANPVIEDLGHAGVEDLGPANAEPTSVATKLGRAAIGGLLGPVAAIDSDTAKRLGRAGVEGTVSIPAAIQTFGDMLHLPRGHKTVQGEQPGTFVSVPTKPGESAVDKLRKVKDELAAEYTKGGSVLGTPIDTARDNTFMAGAADTVGSLAPALAAGPLAPAVIAAQVSEAERARSLAAGDSEEIANAKAQLAIPAGFAMASLAPFGGTKAGLVRRVLTRGATGAGTGALGSVGLDIAEQRPVDLSAAAKNAKTMAAFGAVLGAFPEKGAAEPASTANPPPETNQATTPTPVTAVPPVAGSKPAPYRLPYTDTGTSTSTSTGQPVPTKNPIPIRVASEPLLTPYQEMRRAARQAQIEEAFNTQTPPSGEAKNAAEYQALKDKLEAEAAVANQPGQIEQARLAEQAKATAARQAEIEQAFSTQVPPREQAKSVAQLADLKSQLGEQEIAQNFKDIPEPTPAAPAAPVETGTGNLSTLGDLIGKDVTFNGYTGKLIRDTDGSFNVLRDIRLKGETPMVEIPDTGKDPSMAAADVGVEPLSKRTPLPELTQSKKELPPLSQEAPTASEPITDLTAHVNRLGPAEFVAWANKQPSGFTGTAYDLGISLIGDSKGIAALKNAAAIAAEDAHAAMNFGRKGNAKALQDATSLAAKGQFFNEAIGAAENTGSAATDPRVAAAHPSSETTTSTQGEPNATSTGNGIEQAGDLIQHPQANEGTVPAETGSGNSPEQSGQVQANQEGALNEGLQGLTRDPNTSTGTGVETPFENDMMSKWKPGVAEQSQLPEVKQAIDDLRGKVAEQAQGLRKSKSGSMADQFGKGGEGGFINFEPIEKAITYGTAMLKKGYTNFVEWAGAMKGYFGDAILPKLQSIWESVKSQPRAFMDNSEALVDHATSPETRSDYAGPERKTGKLGELVNYTVNSTKTQYKRIAPEILGRIFRFESELRQNVAQAERPGIDFDSALKDIATPAEQEAVKRAALDGDFEAVRRFIQDKAAVNPEASAKALDAFNGNEQVLKNVADAAHAVGAQFEELGNYWPRIANPDTLPQFLEVLNKDQPGPWTKALQDAVTKFQNESEKQGLAVTRLSAADMKNPAKLAEALPIEIRSMVANQVARGFKPGIRDSALSNNFKNRSLEKIPEEYSKFYLDASKSNQLYIQRTIKMIEKRKLLGSVDGTQPGSLGELIAKLHEKGRISDQSQIELDKLLETHLGKGESGRMMGLVKKLRDLDNIVYLGQIRQAILNTDDILRSALGNGITNAVKGAFGKKEIPIHELGLENVNIGDTDPITGIARKITKASGVEGVTKFGQGGALQAGLLHLRQLASAEPASGKFSTFKYDFEPVFGPERFTQLVSDLKKGNITTDVKTAAFVKLANLFPITTAHQAPGYLANPNARVLLYRRKSWQLSGIDMIRDLAIDRVKNGSNLMNDPASSPRQVALGKQLVKEGYINAAKLAVLLVGVGGVSQSAADAVTGGKATDLSNYLLDNLLYSIGLPKSLGANAKRGRLYQDTAGALIPGMKTINAVGSAVANQDIGKLAPLVPLIGDQLDALVNPPKQKGGSGRSQRKR